MIHPWQQKIWSDIYGPSTLPRITGRVIVHSVEDGLAVLRALGAIKT